MTRCFQIEIEDGDNNLENPDVNAHHCSPKVTFSYRRHHAPLKEEADLAFPGVFKSTLSPLGMLLVYCSLVYHPCV